MYKSRYFTSKRRSAVETPQSFYRILVEGSFDPEKVIVEKRPGTLKRTPESEAFLDQAWAEVCARGFKPWPNDTKPSRGHLARAYTNSAGELILEIDTEISYRDVRASRHRYPDFAERFGIEYVPASFSAALYVIAQNRRGEECLLVELRGQDVDANAGGITVGAGGVVSSRSGETPFWAAIREGEEEAGIKAHELESVVCMGAVLQLAVPDGGAMFVARTQVPAEELAVRKHDGENQAVYYLPIDVLCREWLVKFAYAIGEGGIGGAVLIGETKYGKQWRHDVERALAERRTLASDVETYRRLERQDMAALVEALRGLS
ncbi:MAG: NUDIX domain-containing protein [Candidatus Sungbacteria bacterium]|nr:NUDIX domain-containing protein [Candidatus Sungbacteria bacterium]